MRNGYDNGANYYQVKQFERRRSDSSRLARLDLAELARLCWIEKWSRKDLARRFGKTETAIEQHFHKLKLKDFNVEGLDPVTKEAVRSEARKRS